MTKVYSSLTPPPRVVVVKKNEGKVRPDDSLTVKDILKRFRKTGNLGDVVQNDPQYSNQRDLSHDSPDFLKLSGQTKMDRADLLKQTNKSLQKHAEKQKAAKIKAAREEKEAADKAAIDAGVKAALAQNAPKA